LLSRTETPSRCAMPHEWYPAAATVVLQESEFAVQKGCCRDPLQRIILL
jgi:hypothetical protein